jgi:hypothetical protein
MGIYGSMDYPIYFMLPYANGEDYWNDLQTGLDNLKVILEK